MQNSLSLVCIFQKTSVNWQLISAPSRTHIDDESPESAVRVISRLLQGRCETILAPRRFSSAARQEGGAPKVTLRISRYVSHTPSNRTRHPPKRTDEGATYWPLSGRPRARTSTKRATSEGCNVTSATENSRGPLIYGEKRAFYRRRSEPAISPSCFLALCPSFSLSVSFSSPASSRASPRRKNTEPPCRRVARKAPRLVRLYFVSRDSPYDVIGPGASDKTR